MELKQVTRKERDKKISISLRVSKEVSEWMAKNKVSPTKLFNEAVKELMEKNK